MSDKDMSVIKFPSQTMPPRPRPIEGEVVPKHARASSQPQAPPKHDPLLTERDVYEVASKPMSVGTSMPIIAPQNRSLALAEKHNFFELCAPVLWGAEKSVQRELFGELLRDLVVRYLPSGVSDLLALKALAAAQWRLNRLIEIQGNLFEAHAESEERDRRGMPRATEYALEIDEQIDRAQAAVSAAAAHYFAVKREVRKAG